MRFDPSFASEPLTVTGSPILTALRVQPRRMSIVGAAGSASQLAVFPLASFTSIKKRACGWIQSIFVTGPVIVAGLLRSYCAAKEWCASTGVEETPNKVKQRPAAKAKER